jgi:rod shape-determining protein MreD
VIRYVRLVLVMVIGVLLQVAVFSRLHIDGAGPDIALVIALALAYRDGPTTGAIAGFAAGFGVDLFLRTPFGLSALAFTLTGYVIGLVQGSLVRVTWWSAPFLSLIGSLLANLLFVVVGTLAGDSGLWNSQTVAVVLIAAMYDTALAFVLFPLVGWANGSGGSMGRQRQWRRL